DLNLQRRIEHGFRRHIDAQPEGAPVDAGLVVLDPSTGAVLAMIGAPDYTAPEMGQLNITTTARHPGSALKPFLYALALEDGATPASLANDSLAAVPGYHPGKRPRERGPARYREALAGSYNLAALDVLESVKPGRLLERLRVAGLGPLPGTGSDYGLSLALGAGRVRLVDLAAAYGAFVTGGLVTSPRATTREPTLTTRVFSREVSWLVLDMLADGGARRTAFGATLPFDLPFPVAAKTGTSSGFADTLAIAATREVVVAAWAGSFDGRGTRGRLAMWSAAPLVRLALLAAAEDHGGRLELPAPPEGIVAGDVCTVTGQRAGAACPHKREWFVRGTVPAELCPRHPE
ncbi:MAG TPA: penicillin-binding transpeptidase domain-containing protein, partial [Polyangia bacterium]